METRGPGRRTRPSCGVRARAAIGAGGATARPRAASGSASEPNAAITNSDAPTRPPRRPNE